MNKTEFINLICEKNPDLSKNQVRSVINHTLDAIREVTSSGENIYLPGFGNFENKEILARKGRNPKTGEEIDISASTRVVAKLSKTWAVRKD